MIKREILVFYHGLEDHNVKIEYLCKKIDELDHINRIDLRKDSIYIVRDNHNIIIRFVCNDNCGKSYRVRRPDYYYGYDAYFISYMEAARAKRLDNLDDIITVLKGE